MNKVEEIESKANALILSMKSETKVNAFAILTCAAMKLIESSLPLEKQRELDLKYLEQFTVNEMQNERSAALSACCSSALNIMDIVERQEDANSALQGEEGGHSPDDLPSPPAEV